MLNVSPWAGYSLTLAPTIVGALLMLVASALAHNPDTSYLRVTLGEKEVELRFTLDIFSLQRIAVLDADGNLEVSRRELEAEAVTIFDYFREHVLFEIDGKEADLGDASAIGWPDDIGDSVALERYHQDLVHFPFVKRVRDMPQDFYVGFDVFEALSERHKIIATVIHGEAQDEIEFTMFEPDYLYDTGYRPTWWRRHRGRVVAGAACGVILVAIGVFIRVFSRLDSRA